MKPIFITTMDHGSVTTVSVGGNIDASTAYEFEHVVHELIDQKKYRIVVDLKELNFMSSTGLGILMSAIEQVREHRGDIKLARANASFQRLISVMGFDKIYQIFEDEESAIAAFD